MRAPLGYTLIELLIALGLGLLLTLLAGSLLQAVASNYRHHSESAWLDDSGRYALDIMAQGIRQGAYVNWDSTAAPPAFDGAVPPAVMGHDAASVSKGSEGIDAPLAAVAHGSDVLALRFAGHGAGASGDGSSVNCGGFGVAAPADDTVYADHGWSIFYVVQDDSGQAELRCKYRGSGNWGADAIVRGVESFQVLYGLDTDTPADGVPNRYLNATAIRTLDNALVLAGATPQAQLADWQRQTHWKRVCSIKLALLLRGDASTRADQAPARYDLFGRSYSDSHGNDLGVLVREQELPMPERWRARRQFNLTVALRNHSPPGDT